MICEVPRLEFYTNLCGNCCWDWPIDNQPKSPKWWPIMFFSATVNSNNWLVCLVQGEFIFTKHKTFLKSLDIHQQVAPNSGWCREKMLIGSFERNSFKLIGGSVWPSPEIRKFLKVLSTSLRLGNTWRSRIGEIWRSLAVLESYHSHKLNEKDKIVTTPVRCHLWKSLLFLVSIESLIGKKIKTNSFLAIWRGVRSYVQ